MAFAKRGPGRPPKSIKPKRGPKPIDWQGIAKAALSSATLISELLPGGVRKGKEWLAKNPTRADSSVGSFSVNTRTGKWSDFATGDSGGNLITLRAYIAGEKNAEAAKWLSEKLGVPLHVQSASAAKKDAAILPQTSSAASSKDEQWTIISPVPDNARLPLDQHSKFGKRVSRFTYHDRDGQVLFHVDRFEPAGDRKQFCPQTLRQNSKTGAICWKWKGPGDPRPLYGLADLAQHPDATVLFVEGEKKADAVAKYYPQGDVIGVSAMGGAGSIDKANLSPLAGRNTVLWPDNDDTGRAAMQKAASLIRDAGAKSVSIVDVPRDWTAKWDIADALPDGVSQDDVQRMVEEAADAPPPEQRSSESIQYSEDHRDEGNRAATSGIDPEAEIDRLARLRALDYERVRELKAKELGIRVSALDEARKERQREIENTDSTEALVSEVMPWPEAVSGADTLDALVDLILEYICLPKDANSGRSPSADAIALWSVHAHAHDAFYTSPILAIESPQKRCGKTRVIDIVQRLTPKSLPAANISPSSLFRVVERDKPTLFIDEGDTFLKNNDELRGVLNSGHTRTSAFVLRTVESNRDHEPRRFSTWAPKAIALIGELPDTLQDRSVVIELKRKLKGEAVARFRADRTGPMTILNRKVARWVADNMHTLQSADPITPEDLNDRAADNWRPLLAIAEVAGGRWPNIARKAASALSGDKEDSDEDEPGIRILMDCREIFLHNAPDAITPAQLIERLCELPEAPWAEWRHGKPITGRGVAKLLKPFDIKSTEPTRAYDSDKKQRYYKRQNFEDAWSRYIPSTAPKNTSQSFHLSQALKTAEKTVAYNGTYNGTQASQSLKTSVPGPDDIARANGQNLGRDVCGTECQNASGPEKPVTLQSLNGHGNKRDEWDGKLNGPMNETWENAL
jgi:putative DNA primase/helicase